MVIFVLLVMIKNISVSILASFDRTKTVEDLQKTLYEKKQEQKYLAQKLQIAKTDAYVEEEARTKLGLTREGEQIIIDDKVVKKEKEMEKEDIPSWRKWLKLFTK